jgi:polar amino acid transport system substrate-binding protein
MTKTRFLWPLLACLIALTFALFGCSSNNSQTESTQSTSSNNASSDYKLIEEGTLTVASSLDYPPFENLENGQAVGLDIDIANEIANELGLTVQVKNLQFDTILAGIAAGGQADIGISGFTVDPERQKTVDFSTSYYTDDLAVAAPKGGDVNKNNAAEKLNQKGVIIAVQSGTSGEDYCKENYPNATIQPFGNSTDAFAAMAAGQANYVCTNYAVVQKMLKTSYSDAEVVLPIATGEEYAIAISKDNPELLKAVNNAIDKLKNSGKIEELTTKWLS